MIDLYEVIKIVDITQALESQFVTIDLVMNSQTKKMVVIDSGRYEKGEFGERLSLGVNIDGKEKIWRPNQESVKNLSVFGYDTNQWIGKVIIVGIEKRKGRDTIIGRPEILNDEISEARTEEKVE